MAANDLTLEDMETDTPSATQQLDAAIIEAVKIIGTLEKIFVNKPRKQKYRPHSNFTLCCLIIKEYL